MIPTRRIAVPPLLAAAALAACADPTAVRPPGPARSVAAAQAPVYTPGSTYFGDNNYVEYLAGDLPVIFTAPHGGDLTPAGIPVRTAGAACGPEVTTVLDANTQDLVRQIRDAFFSRTGRYPHVIINRLHRNRLDANREIVEAACGNAAAEEAWRDYHAFVDAAKAAVLAASGRGWYTDVHGHGHAIPRLELGYELSATTLRRSDAELNGDPRFENASSIETFSQASPLSFAALLRGPTALGTLFANAGYPSVPSQQDPAPDVGEDYFNGGYNTDRHACSNGGQICGVQIEANNAGVRNTARNRGSFASAIVATYGEYLAQFGIALPLPPAPGAHDPIVVDDDNVHNDWSRARFAAPSSWTSGANSQSFRDGFALHSAATGSDGAEFRVRVAVPGTYAVEAWWPAQGGRSSGAAYLVYEPEGTAPLATVTRSQRDEGQRWNALGSFRFSRAGWARVVLSRAASASDGSLAADAVRLTLVSGEQSVAFTSAPPAPGITGRTYAAAAAATSGLPATITSLAEEVCTVSGTTVTLVAAGTCTLAADQAGGGGWAAAPRATQSFAVEMPRVAVQPATISLSASNSVTVTLYGSAAFDAALVAPATVRLLVAGGSAAGAPVAQRAGVYSASTRDVDGDGRADRVLLFNRTDLVAAGLSLANTKLALADLTGVYRFRATPSTNPQVGP